ncbi:MAG TPA: RNA polymerase sigma factor region1.1 domain-containing protein, partial [Bacillota bacterium]|nr:RNA polymerase sigma factor region1.1 domain-containing protein [Bacillota bacterium]
MARSKVTKTASKPRLTTQSLSASQTTPPPAAPARPPLVCAAKPVNGANGTAANGARARQGLAVNGATVLGKLAPKDSAHPDLKNLTPEIAEKIKELVRLSQEQGYVTYSDITEVLPDSLVTPEALDEIYSQLRNLEVEIVDQAEVDRVKQPEPEEEDEKSRLDILDDPVRMYLKQMGQVPLLTREQEVEISKRIEVAEQEVTRIIYSFGFAAKEHIALAEKLVAEPPKERFDRVILDKKIDSRDAHLRALRKLMKLVHALDQQVDETYAAGQTESSAAGREKLQAEFKKLDRKLQNYFPKFFYKQKVIEEMAMVAENIHDKFQMSLRLLKDLEAQQKIPQQQLLVQGEQRKMLALEEFVRMPHLEYLQAYQQLKLFT